MVTAGPDKPDAKNFSKVLLIRLRDNADPFKPSTALANYGDGPRPRQGWARSALRYCA